MDDVWARGYLGRAQLAGGNYERALGHFDEAVAIAKSDHEEFSAELMKRRGYAYWLSYRAKGRRLSGNLEGALSDLAAAEKLLEDLVGQIDINYPMARAEMAFIKFEQGLTGLALAKTDAAVLNSAMASMSTAKEYLRHLAEDAPESAVWPRRIAEIDEEVSRSACTLDVKCATSELQGALE